MINIPPRTLQNALIFYITCILIFTNGFFAILTFSRENLQFYNEGVTRAVFVSRLLEAGAREFFQKGRADRLEEFSRSRAFGMEEVKVSLYDRNWWVRWGDPARVPAEGFPREITPDRIVTLSGIPGFSSREVFLVVSSGTEWLGTLGIGIPELGSVKAWNALQQIILTTFINLLLGIMLAIFISQIILRPLGIILDGLQAIRAGDYRQRVTVSGGGEFETLGEMFNRMAASLQEKINEGLERNRTLDEKVQELWEIYELTKAMGFSPHLASVLDRFLEKALTLSFSSYGQILLYNPESRRLEPQVQTPSFPRIHRKDYEAFLHACLESGETRDGVSLEHSLLFIPLVSGRAVQGVLFLAKAGNQAFSEGVRRFLETIAPLGGSLIESGRLYQHVVEMKDYVRNVLDSVDSGVATIDVQGRLVTVNAAFDRLLGLGGEVQRWLNHPLVEVLPAPSDPKLREEWLHLFRKTGNSPSPGEGVPDGRGGSETVVRQEFPLPLADGHSRIIQLRIFPLLAGHNRLGQVVVIDDLTSMRLMERKLIDTEKWVSLGRLAASVAHEIRNPLVAISSLVEMIGEEVSAEQQRHIQVILGEVRRLNNVVEQLLNLSRPERTQPRVVQMVDLLEELLLLVRHETVRHQVSLVREWPPGPVYATIDPEKIKQVVLNVMLNGIQAMTRGGVMTVTLKLLPPPDGRLEKPGVELVITDEGEGIPQEAQRRLFDPFFTTRIHGTGLGLAISKKIIDLHQGQIDISSQVDRGTRVRIVLPNIVESSPPADEQK